MLSERDHRVLARIERQLIESDPDFARLFADHALRSSPAGSTPTFLLIAGLALLVIGSIVAVVAVAVAGMVLSMVALFAAHARPGGFTRPPQTA